jgi:hypothetical protein
MMEWLAVLAMVQFGLAMVVVVWEASRNGPKPGPRN